MSVKKILDNIK